MTTPPLHNTDDQRVVHILGNCFCRYDSTDCWYMQHYQRRGIDKLQVNAILSLLAEAEKRGVLMGAAEELDMLWENSHYRTGPDTSKQIEERMIMLFGKDWTADIYVHIDKLKALRQKESKDERSKL